MKSEKKNSGKGVFWYYEQWYPFIWAFALTIVIIIFNVLPWNGIVNDNILNAVISLTSILLGFLGVFIALVFSIMHFQIVEIVFKEEHFRNRLQKFFMRSCRSGFILIFFTIILFFRKWLEGIVVMQILKKAIILGDMVKYVWGFLLIYFCLSTYQVISIVIKMAFSERKNEVDEDKQDYSELREKYKM